MKKYIIATVIAFTAVLPGCTGPEGPRGPAGPAGNSIESEVFEVTTSFTASNNFSRTFSLTPNILPSDNILVYELYDYQDNIDTWALLPQVYYFPQGTAQYNYNFSYDQFTLLIDADFDRTLLPENFTQNKVFRIVIIPGYFSTRTGVDVHDYHAVVEALGLDKRPVRKLQ